MKKFLSIAGIVAALSLLFQLPTAPAFAQQATVVATCGTATVPTGYASSPLIMNTAGLLCDGASGTGTAANQVQGNTASGTADSGNPVKVGGVYNATPPTFVDGQRGDLQLTQRGQLGVSLYNTAGSAVTVQSSGADGVSNTQSGLNVYARGVVFNGTTWDRAYSANAAAATTGLGVPAAGVLGVYNSTLPTYTAGQYGNIQTTANGELRTANALRTQAGTDGVANNVLGAMFATNGDQLSRYLQVAPLVFNGTNWDRYRSIPGADFTGLGVQATANAPHSNANGANAPTAGAAVASNLVVKASAGNLYGWRVVAGASAGFVMVFDATTAPADGAVTPKDCVPVAANGTVGVPTMDIPERYSTGIVLVFSTTGCYTKTASATAFIRATFQ